MSREVKPARRNGLAQWARGSLRPRVIAVVVVPLLALFAVFFSVRQSEREVRVADQIVVHFYDTRASLVQIRSSINEAEAGVRGYLSSGESYFLTEYDRAVGSLNTAVTRLEGLSEGLPDDVSRLPEVKRDVLALTGTLQQLRDSRSKSGDLSVLMSRETGLMGKTQSDLDLAYESEEGHFFQARYDRDMKRQSLFRTVMICGIVGPIGALLMHLLFAGRMVRRIQAVEENARRLAHGLPLDPFPPGRDEISTLARQLDDAAYLLREREREVRESEARYRDLFDRAPIAFEEIDRDGVVRRFNQAVCSLLKVAPEDLLGRMAWDPVSPDQQETFRTAMLERLASAEETAPFESEFMLADGSRFSVEVRESLIRNQRGEVTGMVRSLLDVTERNLAALTARKVSQYAMELRNKNEQLARALDAARSATEAKSRFLASVSHELRTPLNGIIGFSELLHDGKLGPISNDHKDVLADILTSARHLLQLINDVLDLSKVEAGRMEFRPEPCRIAVLVEEVRDVIRPLAERKTIDLSTEVASNLTAVIDPARFKQVLYNYLSNAVKFTPPNGKVQVRVTREEGSCFRLEVEDTGIGIAPEEIPRLFQEFQQLPNSRKADQGTGLGLALTRHIVEAQGGSVAVRSVPGSGSAFAAVLPLVSISIPVAVPR